MVLFLQIELHRELADLALQCCDSGLVLGHQHRIRSLHLGVATIELCQLGMYEGR